MNNTNNRLTRMCLPDFFEVEYPTISDLYPLSKKVDSHSIQNSIKKLRKDIRTKSQQHSMWVKYDVTLTDYLDKDRMSKELSDTVTKVLTYTYPFHSNKRKSTFLKKLLLVLLEMNLAGEVGEFKGEFILYYKMMVLFPNYRAAETMHEELNQSVNFVQHSGKAKPLDNRHKFDATLDKLLS